jgi:hypothetical protein
VALVALEVVVPLALRASRGATDRRGLDRVQGTQGLDRFGAPRA